MLLSVVLLLAAAPPAFAAFGPGGKATLDLGEPGITEGAVAYPGSRLLLLGGFFGGEVDLVRVGADGSVDGGFEKDRGIPYSFTDVVTLPDGRIAGVSGGLILEDGHLVVAVSMLSPGGQLDPSFGVGGRATVDFGMPRQYGVAIGHDSAGRILVGAIRGTDPGDTALAVARLSESGVLDRTFGARGIASLGRDREESQIRIVDGPGSRILVTADNRLLEGDLSITSLSSSGGVGRTFSVRKEHPLPGFEGFSPSGGVDVQRNGKILVSGTLSRESRHPYGRNSTGVARFLPSGEIDRAYGEHGFAVAPAPSSDRFADAQAAGRDGRAYVAWHVEYTATTGKRPTTGITAFTAGGKVDRRFGHRGTAVVGHERWGAIEGLFLQRNRGRVLIVGESAPLMGHLVRIAGVPLGPRGGR